MRSALACFYFLFLLVSFNSLAFAQDPSFKQRLDSLKAKNDLQNWIYQRIDYAIEKPAIRLSYLTQTKKEVWRKTTNEEEDHAYLSLLNTQGYYFLLDGNILESINCYEAAYAYYVKQKASNYEIAEYTLKPLSNNYTRLGDYEMALKLQLSTLGYLINTQAAPNDIASMYSSIAISYRSMGKLENAEKSVRNGLKLATSDAHIAIMLNNILADIFIDKKNYPAAIKLLENNLVKLGTAHADNAYLLMGTYNSAGLAYLQLKDTKKADTYLTKALALISTYFKGNRLREKANLHTLKGKVKLLQHQPLLALNDFKETLSTLKIAGKDGQPIISKIYGDYRVTEVFEQMANAYISLQKPDEAFNAIKMALFSAEKIRNEFIDDLTKERLQADFKYLVEKAIDIGYQSFQATQNKEIFNTILELAEQSKARTLLDRINNNQLLASSNIKDPLFAERKALERAISYNEKQEIEAKNNQSQSTTAALKFDLILVNKKIKQKYKQFNPEDHKISIAQLLSGLPQQRIIEYFVGQESIYLIDIKNQKVNNVIKIENAPQLKASIQSYSRTYFQQGPSAMLNAPKAFYQAAHQLYQSILKGISFVKNEKVIIVPDEVLGYISFASLLTDGHYQSSIAKWPFLIKNNTITYAFSLKTLLGTTPTTSNQTFTGLFITHQKNSQQPLKAVEAEAAAIQKTVSGDFLFNKQVNISSFNQAFEKSKVLHIGTHAYLSGKNQEPTLDFDQEKLFLFELAAQKQAPALVILSACRTADGLLANGEGVISLSRGFNAIGTSATIAGLWNVNDVAASVIMGNFYKHLLQDNSSGMALHQAKLDWLNSVQTTEALYLPYYWDSLIFMGTDQQIQLAPPTNWTLIVTITILLFSAVTLFFIIRYQRRVKRKVFSH